MKRGLGESNGAQKENSNTTAIVPHSLYGEPHNPLTNIIKTGVLTVDMFQTKRQSCKTLYMSFYCLTLHLR